MIVERRDSRTRVHHKRQARRTHQWGGVVWQGARSGCTVCMRQGVGSGRATWRPPSPWTAYVPVTALAAPPPWSPGSAPARRRPFARNQHHHRRYQHWSCLSCCCRAPPAHRPPRLLLLTPRRQPAARRRRSPSVAARRRRSAPAAGRQTRPVLPATLQPAAQASTRHGGGLMGLGQACEHHVARTVGRGVAVTSRRQPHAGDGDHATHRQRPGAGPARRLWRLPPPPPAAAAARTWLSHAAAHAHGGAPATRARTAASHGCEGRTQRDGRASRTPSHDQGGSLLPHLHDLPLQLVNLGIQLRLLLGCRRRGKPAFVAGAALHHRRQNQRACTVVHSPIVSAASCCPNRPRPCRLVGATTRPAMRTPV
jgi:hypothetical protein